MDFLLCRCFMFSVFVPLALFLAFVVWFICKADADVTLLLYERLKKRQSFSGKVVWITGASSGIGEYLAYDLIQSGAKLVISGTSVEKLEKVKQNCLDISAEAENILILPFLMEDFSGHAKCVEKVLNHFGRIDILVNNAGVSQRAKFQDIEIDVDLKLFNVNVFGLISLTRQVLPHFLERKEGQIVVTSSTAGKLGAPFSSAYTGSKHALHGYFEALRSELTETNISICIACPGPVFSNLTSRCLTGRLGELYDEKQLPTDKKMATQRCSELMRIAMENNIHECWICFQPLLLLYYLSQYCPTFFRSVIVKYFFNARRVQAMRSGK